MWKAGAVNMELGICKWWRYCNIFHVVLYMS